MGTSASGQWSILIPKAFVIYKFGPHISNRQSDTAVLQMSNVVENFSF